MIKKTFIDIFVITRIYYLQFRDQIARFLFFGFLIPAGVYYIANASTGRDPALQLRFFTASMLLSFSMLTIMWLGTIIVEDRFYGRLKLLITTPISRTSYVLGILGYDYILGLMTGCGFIVVSYLFEIHVQLNFLDMIILVFLTLSSLTGISIIVSQQAKSLQAGSVLADSTSICLIFFAPVFYPAEELPKVMQYVVSLFPTTYAVDGMAKALSGKGRVGMDMLALLIFSIVTLLTAIRSLRWRDF
ncbi:MAG: ABC transporter permease [Deltaproteobacteria bacterium]|nr:ABC transporter permease [Deltaproteobacteria bacterium]